MGQNNSKQQQDDEPAEGNIPSTPILTPKFRMTLLDPRSPSTNIVRTPIQNLPKSDPGTPIIGIIDSKKLSGDQKIDSIYIDPRSPTVEFTRTPITIINKEIGLVNKHLSSVKQQMSFDFTPDKPAVYRPAEESINTNDNGQEENGLNKAVNDDKEVSVRKPKLLEVTPITKNPESKQKRQSTVGLLETNLDYVETNIDDFVPKGEILDPLFSLPAPELKPKTDATIEKQVVQIENLTKDFDKKLANLIYEDCEDDAVHVPARTSGGRTVLGERNGPDTRAAVTKLKVSDKPCLKKNKSKIPVYQKALKQCENTPPQKHTKKKGQWDADSTLII